MTKERQSGRKRKKLPVEMGKELEDAIGELAEANGWRAEKRKKYGERILDLIVSKGGIVFVVQSKNTSKATPADVTQTEKDFESYIDWLLEEKLGLKVMPVLISQSFSKGAKSRARGYGVLLYTVDEFRELMEKRKGS